MKIQRISLVAGIALFFMEGSPILAQDLKIEGYHARLSWPVVEKMLSEAPVLKEFLADGDYETYVMVYHPAPVWAVKRVNPAAVLEETALSEEWNEKVRQSTEQWVSKDPLWKKLLYAPVPDLPAENPILGPESEIQQAAVDIPEDLLKMDRSILSQKLEDLRRIYQSAGPESRRADLENEIKILEEALRRSAH
ncbi:MAG: hypothetical protein N2050_05530 [Flavobacteriales bacterium]|nr:hypothetical protein [Flavobacteriales bacterium]